MTRPSGVCRLHLGAELPLRNSHSISSWAFSRAMAPGSGQFVNLHQKAATLSNNQRRDYLLCEPCEQAIGRWESYASTLARQADGSTPLLNMLEPAPMLEGIYRAPSLDVEALARFGVSVFWRASTSAAFPDFELGPHHEEALRGYLNGEAAFPDQARLTLAVIKAVDAPVDQIVASPAGRRADGYRHEHVFVVHGLHFLMSVGSKFPAGIDAMCFVRTGLISLSDGKGLRDRILQLGADADIKGALKKQFPE